MSGRNLVLDETVKLACTIFRYVLDELPKVNGFEKMDLEQQYMYICNMEEYKKFVNAYPLVIRYMVQYKTFRVKAFKKFVKHLMKTQPTESEKKEMVGNPNEKFYWMNKQKALYVKWLYTEASGTHNMNEAIRVYNETLEALNNDSDVLYKSYQKVKNEQDDKNKDLTQLMREELLKDILS